MYTNLHSHSHYSLLDGLSTPDELAKRAKELGMPAVALTDHGTLSGNRDLLKAAERHGVKPILGIEAYISETDRFDRRSKASRDDGTQTYNHLIVLAKDANGYENLSALSTAAWREGFYYKPRIDRELLEEHSSGLIVLSGCLNGLISKAIERGDEEGAIEHAKWFKDVFGDDFYMELQAHNPAEINTGLLRIARDLGIKPLATLDCHFTTKEDRVAEELLLILSTKPRENKDYVATKAEKMDVWEKLNYIYPERQMSFEHLDLYMMDAAELGAVLEEQGLPVEELINNTLDVTDKIGQFEKHEGVNLLPSPKADPYATLAEICFTELRNRKLGEEYRKRLVEEELPAIQEKNFASYFLIVADIVGWAKKQGIRVGPGRGSAAGSLVVYLLGITNVDPIEHDLLFGRFINVERNDMPDIDIDVQDTRRGEVKAYVERRFKNVATVSTFNKFSGPGTVKDVARVFRVPIKEVEDCLKTVDSLDDFYNGADPAIRVFKSKHPEVEKYVRQLEGRIRGVGMHAGGVVVSSEPVDRYAPIEYRDNPDSAAKDRIPVVALDKDSVEELGLLKIDLLGLKALSLIDTALANIKKHKGVEVDLDKISYDDQGVYQMLSDGFTRGVFQAEAGPYTMLLKNLKPSVFDELSISTALVRPGAMNTIGEEYLDRKQGRKPVVYANDTYRGITEKTLGTICFQEQVMRACVELAGMSWSQADKIRKIIGKKKDVSEFDEYKALFIDGSVDRGIQKAYAEKLWHDFEAHAGYSFNASHSVAYSILTYQTAWLKHHYPLEYMAAVLAHEGDAKAITGYLLECKRLGLRILLPDVNRSEQSFSIDGNAIRFGLANIKFIAEAGAQVIIDKRPFRSREEFTRYANSKGSGLSKRIIGALDSVNAMIFPDNPAKDVSGNLYEFLGIPSFDDSWMTPEIRSRLTPCAQLGEGDAGILYGMVIDITSKPGAKWNKIEVVDESGSATFFSGPVAPVEKGKMYVILAGSKNIQKALEVGEARESDEIFARYLRAKNIDLAKGSSLVIEFNTRKTKKGDRMATATLIDHSGRIKSILVFPSQYPSGLKHMQPGAIINYTVGYTKDGTEFVERVRRIDD